ncbi:UNVERIFIED_CONTAM: Ribosomal protein S3, mitochondrial [Sesamum calycinum]|uniref:Ribosomal protein S3, mitochondrial n=1 Tax=Sesamum calycinum TaxID=2727403 RepID=A0AAW2IVC8_9LAMI
MGQRIKRFDFVSRDPPQVGFESRVMGVLFYIFPKNIHSFLSSPSTTTTKTTRKIQTRKAKGRWWEFGKVGPIGCLHSSDGTEEERNKVRGRGSGKRVESIRLDDREKQNEIRIWPKKKQGYGYHDRSPSIKKNLSKSLRVSGAFKHPKYAGVVNGIAFLIENDDSFRKTKLFKFFFPKKSRSDGPTSHLLKRTLPAVRSSLNYSVMQYLLNTKNKMHFDPVVVLNHFVAPGVAEPSTMGGANAQERSLDKRIRSRIAFFVESSTSEKKCLAEAKKRLTHFIRQANDLRFAGTTKTTISLFPFFGATFFFPRDGVGVYNNLFFENAREQLLGQLRRKCWNLMAKDKVMELIEKFIDLGRSEGAEIARTECGKYGKTSRNVFNQKIDYAPAEVSTRYGILGRLSYRAIEAARRAIIGHFHRAMSGQFRRNGKIWVRVLADIPITGKPTEVRMGRGKGNPTGWIARVSTGQILFEMDGKNSFLALMLSFSVPRREIDVMIPESCDMDSAVNGFIMLLIGKNADEECVEKRHKTLGGWANPPTHVEYERLSRQTSPRLSIGLDERSSLFRNTKPHRLPKMGVSADGVAMMSLTPSLDPPQVESLSSGGHSFLSGNAPPFSQLFCLAARFWKKLSRSRWMSMKHFHAKENLTLESKLP